MPKRFWRYLPKKQGSTWLLVEPKCFIHSANQVHSNIYRIKLNEDLEEKLRSCMIKLHISISLIKYNGVGC